MTDPRLADHFSLEADTSAIAISDVEILQVQAIALSPADFERAIAVSDPIADPEAQWQVYRDALALGAFETWVDEQMGDTPVMVEACSVLQPAIAPTLPGVCGLHLCRSDQTSIPVCLVTTGSGGDSQVLVPRVALESSDNRAALIIWIEVAEELEMATVMGSVRRDQLIDRLNAAQGKMTHGNTTHGNTTHPIPTLDPMLDGEHPTLDDRAYAIPLTWLERDVDRLLLYLRCLEPSAIAAMLAIAAPVPVLAADAATAATDAAIAPPQATPTPAPTLPSWLEALTAPAIRVSHWLRDELDETARQLAWTLAPEVVPALRSPAVETREFANIVQELQTTGTAVPHTVRGAHRTLVCGGVQLRVYVLAWRLGDPTDTSWWSLAIVVSSLTGELPLGLQLHIGDTTGVLVEETVTPDTVGDYLFGRVVGGYNEKFAIALELNHDLQILPPFAYAD